MAGDLVQHMVEERHARVQLLDAGAIEVDGNADLGLAGVASDFCGAVHEKLLGFASGRQGGFQAVQHDCVFLGRTDRDAQAVGQYIMHSTHIFNQNFALEQFGMDLVGV